ncbi:hypothetical protein ACJX0J_012993, partial [Zea mays]
NKNIKNRKIRTKCHGKMKEKNKKEMEKEYKINFSHGAGAARFSEFRIKREIHIKGFGQYLQKVIACFL